MVDGGQEEPIGRGAIAVQVHGSSKGCSRRLPVARPVTRDPEGAPRVRLVRVPVDGLPCDSDGLGDVAGSNRHMAHEVPRLTTEWADQLFSEAGQRQIDRRSKSPRSRLHVELTRGPRRRRSARRASWRICAAFRSSRCAARSVRATELPDLHKPGLRGDNPPCRGSPSMSRARPDCRKALATISLVDGVSPTDFRTCSEKAIAYGKTRLASSSARAPGTFPRLSMTERVIWSIALNANSRADRCWPCIWRNASRLASFRRLTSQRMPVLATSVRTKAVAAVTTAPGWRRDHLTARCKALGR